MEFSPDDRISNYRVERELGTSGSGLLLQVQHLVLPRRAILKVVRAAFARVEPYVLQTLREAYILEAIAHPGVPIIYEAGLLPDRRPWLAFEPIHGRTVDELLGYGAFPLIEIAALLRDLAELLEHVHQCGVFHRGLRPDRIVITAAGRYPLCIPDWSEAVVHDATHPVRQAVPEAARSYFAPELLRHHAGGTEDRIDGSVDVFALGVIAHRALTGSLPIAPGLGTEPYAPSIERRPDAPPALAALIDAMLSFHHLDRPSAYEVRATVERLMATVPALQVPTESWREPPCEAVAAEPPTAVPTPPLLMASPDTWESPDAWEPPDTWESPDAWESPAPSDEPPASPATTQSLRSPRWTPQAPYFETPERTDPDIAEDEFSA